MLRITRAVFNDSDMLYQLLVDAWVSERLSALDGLVCADQPVLLALNQLSELILKSLTTSAFWFGWDLHDAPVFSVCSYDRCLEWLSVSSGEG